MKAEGLILGFIVALLLMCIFYLGYFIYLTAIKEGYTSDKNSAQEYNRFKGITNICSPYDADYNAPYCIDVSFSDYDNSIRSVKAILDPGYGRDPNTGFVTYVGMPTKTVQTKIPIISNPSPGFQFQKDYTVNPNDGNEPSNTKNIPRMPSFKPSIDNKNDQDNIDIQYHADPSELSNAEDDLIGYTLVKNDKGEIVPMAYSDLKGQTLYNQPGTSRFGPSSYVPNYEETVFLSKLTNEIPFLPISKQESGSVGFCQQNANGSLDAIEKKCGSLDNETCASTECCVLFGGAKCVAGNERGPSIQSNYSDFLVKNRDYYYYKGKCYGNCTRSYGIKNTTGYGNENLYATYSPNIMKTPSNPTNNPTNATPWDWKNWKVNNDRLNQIVSPLPTQLFNSTTPVDTSSYTTSPVDTSSYTTSPVDTSTYTTDDIDTSTYTTDDIDPSTYTTDDIDTSSYTTSPVDTSSYTTSPVDTFSYTTTPS